MAEAKRIDSNKVQSLDSAREQERLTVLKTYKLYIGGAFPRTESGRYYQALTEDGVAIANVCQASRKDFRNAVVVARAAQSAWASKTAYNRAQILYRIAEMLEGRSLQFIAELVSQGLSEQDAKNELNLSVDRLVYYAGWADKYQQIFSSMNPVSTSHFNFSCLEANGVTAIIAPENPSLLGLISNIAPAIVGGNTVVILASQTKPLTAITLGEVLHSSDLPGGVVNILTGSKDELLEWIASHKDVNSMVYCGGSADDCKQIQEHSIHNLKRIILRKQEEFDWFLDSTQNPYLINDTQEVKTTWHPVKA